MRRRAIRFVLAGLFTLVLSACEDDGPTGGDASGDILGMWGQCFESTRCETVLDDGYRITADSFSFVELSGYEEPPFQSDECGKCAKAEFTNWTWERLNGEPYTRQGNTLSLTWGPDEDVTITVQGAGRIRKVTIRISDGESEEELTEYWTRLSGDFEELRVE